MYGVVGGVHQRERERGSERRLGVTRYSRFFASIYSFCRGSRRLLPTSEKQQQSAANE